MRKSGRYIVQLPFKNSEPHFDYNETRSIALHRFNLLEKRLLKSPELYKQYSDFIQEYLDLNYLESVANNPNLCNTFYIPHHHIIKPDSTSTKLRVVFDGSVQTSLGSLNDQLLAGPKLHKDIVTILLHFRMHNIVFTTDIKSM